MLGAGIAPLDAWRRLRPDERPAVRVGRLEQVLLNRGVIDRAQAARVAIAADAGQLEPCLEALAAAIERREMRWKRLRSRALLSCTVLGIGIIAGFVVTQMHPDQGLAEFLSRLLPGILPLAGLLWLTHYLASRDILWWGARYWQWPAPLRSAAVREAFEFGWYGLLQNQLHAGRDAESALAAMRPLIQASALEQYIARARELVRQGKALGESLQASGLPMSRDLAAAIHVGENSGRLTESMAQALARLEQQLEDRLERIVRVWPWVLYAVALIGAAKLILDLP